MDIISRSEFENILNHSDSLIIKLGRANKPKVIEKNGSTIIKLFYPKVKWFTSDKIKPRALRFYNNIQSLYGYGYNTPRLLKHQYCTDLKTHLIHYHKIEGHDVRSLVTQGNTNIIHNVIQLIADLHQNGIYFRAVHLENLLYTSDNKLALIDVTDVTFKRLPLSIHLRYRNIKHLLLVTNDKTLWQTFGIDNFLKKYCELAALSVLSQKLLSYLVKRAITRAN